MSGILVETPSRLTGGCMRGAYHCNRCFIKGSPPRIEGETNVFEDIGSSSLRVGRRSCGRCGSPLTTEPDVVPDLMMVKVGGIDNNGWLPPVMELSVTRRRPWVEPVPGAQQFDGNPPV